MSAETNTSTPLAEDEKPGVVVIGDEEFMRDTKGRLVPEKHVKPLDKLIDQTVRFMIGHAEELSSQIGRFKGHTFDDVGALEAQIAEEYKTKIGGQKGNITLTTFDGLQKVTVQVADQITFGPELQAAKALIDECIVDWSDGANSKIRVLVEHAFDVDQEGRINRGALFQLRRVAIDDERWQRAMVAIGDSIRVVGSKSYVRFHKRATAEDAFEPISIDLASAKAPKGEGAGQ